MSDREKRQEYEENYLYAKDYWSPYVSDAMVYNLAAAGRTWTDNELKALELEGREPIEFNIVRRPIDFLSGYLRDNLNSIVISPVEGSDEETAKQFTKLSYYIWDKGRGYKTFLDASDEMLKSGMSLCGIQMDYSKDFINGDITFFKRTFNSFFLDPTFESLDLNDCSFAITRDIINPAYAKQLLKDVDPKVIDQLPYSFRDNKFLSFHPQFTNMTRSKNMISYDQYYRRTTRMREFLIDLRTDYYRDITDLGDEERKKLEYGMGRLQSVEDGVEGLEGMEGEIPKVEIRKVERPYIELNVFCNGQLVYEGDDHTGIVDSYPFAPLVCYFEPSIWIASKRVQGIAAVAWSNQRQFNKRHMKIQDMFDSVISTGYKYLLGSVPDVSDLQQSGQNKIIGVDPENAPEGLNSVQELQGGNVPQALMEYAQMLDKLNLTLTNVNESVLGVDEKGNTQVSGRLAQIRIAQGLTSNRKVLDNIECTQQIIGGLVLDCLQKRYSQGKVERILGETPTEQFYNSEFEQYDSQIKEGVRSKSQKDAYYYELVSLVREKIVDVPPSEIVRALEMSGIDDLKEAIEGQEEQQAQQQAKIDEQERVGLELANSQKISNLSLAKEREARVLADIGLAEERHSEAASNQADAVLARAKAVVEIASLNEDRILKVLGLINQFHNEEEIAQEKVSEKSKSLAAAIDNDIDSQESVDNMQQQASASSLLGESQQGISTQQ